MESGYALLLLAFLQAVLFYSVASAGQVYIVKTTKVPHVAVLKGLVRDRVAPAGRHRLSLNQFQAKSRREHVNLLQAVSGRSEGLLYSYSYVVDGFAAVLTSAQAAILRRHPDITDVSPDRGQKKSSYTAHPLPTHAGSRKLLTSYTPHFLGLDGRYGLYKNTTGRGMIVGVIDDGIWPEVPSFSARGMGRVPSRWKGSCAVGDGWTAHTCNRKIIGAKYFSKGWEAASGFPLKGNKYGLYASARTEKGNGCACASIAAGSFVSNATIYNVPYGSMHGMAPRAHIAVYKVFFGDADANRFATDGYAYDSDILAALEAAVRDGVDVISLSASPPQPAFLSSVDIGGFLAASAGVLMVTSEGDYSESFGSVVNNAPWYMTVAPSYTNRDFGVKSVKLGSGVSLPGLSNTAGTTPAGIQIPLVWSQNASLANASNAIFCLKGTLDPLKVRGKIVVCKEDTLAGLSQSIVVKEAGGVGVILYYDISAELTAAPFHVLPAINVKSDHSQTILSYISDTKNPTASFSVAVASIRGTSPTMNGLSVIGPNFIPSFMKPDVTAPGFGILAAWSPQKSLTGSPIDTRVGEPFNLYDGSKAACPHVSGVALLLRAIHPAWTPGMVQSALITTAYTIDSTGKSIGFYGSSGFPLSVASPLYYGAGHINPQAAAMPGLVYDQTIADFLNLLCNSLNASASPSASGGVPFSLYCSDSASLPRLTDYNYPSISLTDLTRGSVIKVHRVVTLVGPPATYTASAVAPFGVSVVVVPNKISFTAVGQSVEFHVVFTAKWLTTDYVATDNCTFGSYTWTDGKHKVKSPIMVSVTRG